jgi:N-acetylmuramoyl-L-alanine amidase
MFSELYIKRRVSILKPTSIKKVSLLLTMLLLVSVMSPILAFAGAFFKDVNYSSNGNVTGQVYFGTNVSDSVYVAVYGDNNRYFTTTTATYNTYNNGYYYYNFNFNVTDATYNPLLLKAFVSNILWGTSDSVYRAASNSPGVGFFIPVSNQLDGTSGTISEFTLKDALSKSLNVEVKIKDTLAIPAAALLDAAKKSGATLKIVGDNGSYELPLSVLKLDDMAKAVGVDLKDLKINISITKLSGSAATAVVDAAKAVGGAALSDAVDFAIVAEGKGKKVAIDSFGSTYVKRTIKTNKAASKTATVALYNPATKALSYVPSVMADTYADFQRTGNSVYVVVENSAKFNDVTSHWAKTDIELLASKLVVDGTGAGKFEADRAITRAEFAALAVKALGLSVSSVVYNTYFSDVAASDWSAGYVAAAKTAGLVDGYEDGTFQGDKVITREELSALVVRALKFAGVDTSITAAKQSTALAKFADSDDIVWAQKEVASAINLGIVNGKTDTTLEVASDATRAESATMLKRLLTKAGFIK